MANADQVSVDFLKDGKQEYAIATGLIIKTTRIRKNISQIDLARRTGLSRFTLTKIEKGSLTPTIWVLYSISEALSVKLHVLLQEIEKEYKLLRSKQF